jgi:hypothetical protein
MHMHTVGMDHVQVRMMVSSQYMKVIARELRSGRSGRASKQGVFVGTVYEILYRHRSCRQYCTIRQGLVLLPCKPPAWMDQGLAHRSRLAGNLDSERRTWLE